MPVGQVVHPLPLLSIVFLEPSSLPGCVFPASYFSLISLIFLTTPLLMVRKKPIIFINTWKCHFAVKAHTIGLISYKRIIIRIRFQKVWLSVGLPALSLEAYKLIIIKNHVQMVEEKLWTFFFCLFPQNIKGKKVMSGCLGWERSWSSVFCLKTSHLYISLPRTWQNDTRLFKKQGKAQIGKPAFGCWEFS